MNNHDPQKPAEPSTCRTEAMLTEAMLQEFFRGEMPVALDSEIPAFRRQPQTARVRAATFRASSVPNRARHRAVVVLLSLMACVMLAFVVSGIPGDSGEIAEPSTKLVVEESGPQMGGMPVSSGNPTTDDESGIADPEHVEIEFPPPESPRTDRK